MQGDRGEHERRGWRRRLIDNIDAWDDLGWAEGIRQIVEVLPEPGDKGDVDDRQGD